MNYHYLDKLVHLSNLIKEASFFAVDGGLHRNPQLVEVQIREYGMLVSKWGIYIISLPQFKA